MAKKETISSTERLLNIIRGKADEMSENTSPSPSKPQTVDRKSPVVKAFAFRKQIKVGVNIGYNDLKIAEVLQTSDKNHELLNFTQIPFEPGLSLDSPAFPRFLKASLTRFCGSSKNIEIWSAISSAQVEIRYLRIPKVPKKQMANAIFWSFRKEVSFDEKNDIFDFEVLGEIDDNGARKTEVMAYSAPKKEVQRLEALFSKSGFQLAGITIIPFVIQNLFRTTWIASEEKNLCSLYIGRDWSRIDIFSHGNLVLSRGIKAGIGSMVEAIRQNVFRSPIEYTLELSGPEESDTADKVEEISPEEYEEARKIFSGFIRRSSSVIESEGLSIESDNVLEMIIPALDRLIRQVERTLEHYSLHFGKERVGKIYVSGPISSQQILINQIGEQLGLPIDVFDPFDPSPSISSGISIPEKSSARESFVPAIGMALSNKAITPNFIFTYKDKAKSLKTQRINYSVFALLILIMLISIGAYFWQNNLIVNKKMQITRLKRQVAGLTPYLDQRLIQELVNQTLEKRSRVGRIGKRYLGLSAISELASLTPSNIRLSSVIAEMGENPEKSLENQKKMFVIDGVVSGERLTFESSLADYLVKLKTSPLFDKPNIKRKSFEFLGNEEVLRFTAELELM